MNQLQLGRVLLHVARVISAHGMLESMCLPRSEREQDGS